MRLVALVEDPAVVSKILSHLGLSPRAPPARRRQPPVEQLTLVDDLGQLDGVAPPSFAD